MNAILFHLSGTHRLIIELMYGTGMCILEVLRLRVKDIDFARGLITIREAKDNKDRPFGMAHFFLPQPRN